MREPRASYPVLREITTRWMDNDVYGHMNNVVYYSLFDTVVNGWLIDAVGANVWELDAIGLVVDTACSFHASLGFPRPVTAGLALEKLGTSSITYRIGLFDGDSEEPAATGRFVHVYVEKESRTVTPVPAAIRAAVEGQLARIDQ